LPELEAQRLIANYLDRQTAQIDCLIAEKERILALLEEKRAALISRVVTSGLDPDVPFMPLWPRMAGRNSGALGFAAIEAAR
jgi:type I restriction enzyme S subunit